MYTSVSAAAKRSHAEGTQPKPSMIHWSRRRRSAWIFRYSSWGTLPPPALNWMASSGCSGSPVISARRLASVDFPPPALPNTATFLTRSFDDLVGSQEQRPGNRQAERAHRAVVDHELELRRLLDGKVTRLRALQDLVDVGGCPPERIGVAGRIRHETPIVREVFQIEDSGQPVLQGQPRKLSRMNVEDRIRMSENQRLIVRFANGGERGLEVIRAPYWNYVKVKAQGLRRDLYRLHRRRLRTIAWIRQDSDVRNPGNGLLEQRKSLPAQLWGEDGQSGDVPARSPQTGDESVLDRAVVGRHDNGNSARRLLGGSGRDGAGGHDHVDLETDQLGGEVGQAMRFCLRETVDDADLLPLDVAEVAQPTTEGFHPRQVGRNAEDADPAYLPRLLRLGKEWAEHDGGDEKQCGHGERERPGSPAPAREALQQVIVSPGGT